MSVAQEAEMDRRIEQVRRSVREGRPERRMAGPVDPYDVRESLRDQLKGRHERSDAFHQVMKAHGFVWYEPGQMNQIFGPMKVIPRRFEGIVDQYGRPIENENIYIARPHTVGQWRRTQPYPLSFTSADLFSLFDTPEKFDAWIRDQDLRRRLARRGIVITR